MQDFSVHMMLGILMPERNCQIIMNTKISFKVAFYEIENSVYPMTAVLQCQNLLWAASPGAIVNI